MATKAVFFDLDDTLILEHDLNEVSFRATCSLAQERLGADANTLYDAIRLESEQLWQAGPFYEFCDGLGIASWEGLCGDFSGDGPNINAIGKWVRPFQEQSWSRALAACGSHDAAAGAELAREFRRDRRSRHVLLDGARDVLTELAGRYQLAMVTNGVPDIQWRKIEMLDLKRYFQTILISGELGFGKPDLKIFEMALEELRTPPTQAVMVGNSRGRDVQGARNAGIRAILLLSSDPETVDTSIVADAEISSLRELPALL